MAATGELQVLQELASDESLQPLMEEQFDPKAFATAAIQNQIVGELLTKLMKGITELDNELYTQVVTHYEDLLSQATGIEALEGVLKMMQSRIDSLTTAVDRISAKIIEPYQKIVSRTAQLTRLQAACDLLRTVIRMLYLIKRAKTLMQGGIKEITKVAQTFSEIDQLMEGNDLAGIKVIDDERAWLQRVKREIETQAKKMLIQGLEHLNPTHVGVALQVFYNLGQLEVTIETVLGSYREAVQHEIQNSIDPSTLLQSLTGGRTLPPGGGGANWKALLWARLEKLTTALMKIYKQVHQLEVVLSKKKDPSTQITFLSSIAESEAQRMLFGFWEIITDNINIEFSTAAKASTFLNQAFENDYPKLVVVFSDLLSQIETLHGQSQPSSLLLISKTSTNNINTSGNKNFIMTGRQESLMKSLSQFEKVYTLRLSNRLNESINQLFTGPGRNLPRKEDLLTIVKQLNSELSLGGSCSPLTDTLASHLSDAIKLFNTKCEQLVITGKQSLQVSGPPNPSQQKNIAIVNILDQFQSLSEEHVLNSPSIIDIGKKRVKLILQETKAVKMNIVSLFVEEVQSVMEDMVESMHKENFSEQTKLVQSSRRDSSDVNSSGFVREMMSFTTRIFQEHFSLFTCQDDLRPLLKGLAMHTLEIYVRQVCLIRPLSESGKMRITSDMAQIELALIPFCARSTELGEPHRMLRSLRRLLFLAPQNFLSQPAGVGDVIPYSYVLNFLFSYAPHDMKSPHQVKNWSEGDYSNWMDNHPLEKDRLTFIQAIVNSFSKKLQHKNETLPPIVSIMNQLLATALNTTS